MDEIRLDASPSGREDIAAPSHQPQIHTWSSRLSDVITRLADAADSAQESSHTPESRYAWQCSAQEDSLFCLGSHAHPQHYSASHERHSDDFTSWDHSKCSCMGVIIGASQMGLEQLCLCYPCTKVISFSRIQLTFSQCGQMTACTAYCTSFTN